MLTLLVPPSLVNKEETVNKFTKTIIELCRYGLSHDLGFIVKREVGTTRKTKNLFHFHVLLRRIPGESESGRLKRNFLRAIGKPNNQGRWFDIQIANDEKNPSDYFAKTHKNGICVLGVPKGMDPKRLSRFYQYRTGFGKYALTLPPLVNKKKAPPVDCLTRVKTELAADEVPLVETKHRSETIETTGNSGEFRNDNIPHDDTSKTGTSSEEFPQDDFCFPAGCGSIKQEFPAGCAEILRVDDDYGPICKRPQPWMDSEKVAHLIASYGDKIEGWTPDGDASVSGIICPF
ncbi:MAG: hypothetical protein KDN19_15300 [Verrucomicrobiae bacterium]|nr:hypothetical protein [Verrucomicrobiae bacterium]